MKQKNFIWIAVSVLVFIILFFLDDLLMSLSTEKTCAQVVGIHSIRNMEYIEYEYTVNNNVIRTDQSVLFVGLMNLNSLKKIECIEIEYSTIWPTHNRIIDKRVGVDSE